MGSTANPPRSLDPNNSDRQQRMLYAWKKFGVEQLKNCIVEIAAVEAEIEHEASLASSGKSYQTSMERLREQARNAGRVIGESEAHGQNAWEFWSSRYNADKSDEFDGNCIDPHEGSCYPFNLRWPCQSVSEDQSQASLFRFSAVQVLQQEEYQNEVLPAFEGAHPSWQLILDDARSNGGRKIVSHLMRIHPLVLTSFLEGTIPRELAADELDETFFEEYTATHIGPSGPGTWATWIGWYEYNETGAEERTPGSGLTPREIMTIYQDLRLYINVADPDSSSFAKKIDRVSLGRNTYVDSLDYSYQRRFGYGKDRANFQPVSDWAKHLESRYFPWILKLPLHDGGPFFKPLCRCLAYVGFSSDLRQVKYFPTETQGLGLVFGLVMSILEYRYGRSFRLFNRCCQIFETADPSDTGFDEVLTTILLSAYPWDGGLSTAYAGVNIGIGKELVEDPRVCDIYEDSRREGRIPRHYAEHRKDMMEKRRALETSAREEALTHRHANVIRRILADAEVAGSDQQ